jgi:hypothetical protein
MRFCDFINKLKPHFSCRSQETFILDIFTALCGGEAPVGLTGDDATYRKLLFSGNNKKYNGLSAPIKAHALNKKNKNTFIAYCDTSVSVKEYPVLCEEFELETSIARAFLFEALYEQFIEFAKSKDDNVAVVVSDLVSEYVSSRKAADFVSMAPLHSGDDFSVTKPRDMTIAFYRDFIVSWTIKNTGSLVWEGRYLYNVNNKQTGVRGVSAKVDIPTLRPDEQVKVEVTINAQGHEKSSSSVWEIYNSEGNPCFPNKQGEITVVVNVINPNRKAKTEVF